MNRLASLLRFVRFRMTAYIASRALIGYLLFNGLGWDALIVFVSAFCSTVAIYGYNQLTDTLEDRANKRESPPTEGWRIVILFVFAGFATAWLLGGVAPYFWLLPLGVGMLYSKLRIKEIFPLKNIYIALGGGLVFLYGASPQMEFVPAMFVGYALMATVAFIVSLEADLRDITGDKKTGVKSIPVVAGKSTGELIAYLAISILAIVTTAMKLVLFYPLAVLEVPAAYHLGRGAHVKSQTYMIISVMMIPAVLIMLRTTGVM